MNSFSAWLSLPQLITWGSVFYTFSLLMAPVEAELGLSRARSSLAFSLALLSEGLGSWWVGRQIDLGRERWVMAAGSLWVGLGLLAHRWVQTQGQFYAVWIWLGLGLSATLYNPAFAVVTRRFPLDFRRAVITITFLGGLASTVFIPLSSVLIRNLGWRDALTSLSAWQFLLCAPLHVWLLRDAPQSDRHPRHAPHSAIRQYLHHAPFWLLAGYIVAMMAVTTALPAHMIEMLQEAGLSHTLVISIPATMGLIQVLGRMMLIVLEHHWSAHAADRYIPGLIPAGLVALLLGGLHPIPALLFVLFYGLGNGMTTILKGIAMAQYVSQRHVGELNGLLGLPIALARAASPWLLGLLWSPDAGYRLGLRWLLLTSMLGMALLWSAQHMVLTPSGRPRSP